MQSSYGSYKESVCDWDATELWLRDGDGGRLVKGVHRGILHALVKPDSETAGLRISISQCHLSKYFFYISGEHFYPAYNIKQVPSTTYNHTLFSAGLSQAGIKLVLIRCQAR